MPALFPPRAEVDALLRDLRTVAGCVTKHLLVGSPDKYNLSRPQHITFGHRRQSAALRDGLSAGSSGLSLDVVHEYQFIGHSLSGSMQHHVMTTAYEYRLLDHDDRELLVFHWHPGPRYAGPNHPHVHISASLMANVSATRSQEIPLDKLHVPTGHVTLSSVVRMLIEEFGIKPLHNDWQRRLDRADANLRRRLPK